MTATAASDRKVRVWDLPTRIFHWSLLALVVIAWLTGEGEGGTARIHRYAGELIAGLLVFRFAWGFVGGEHARFANFLKGPAAVGAHIRDLASQTPHRHLGHNPLGGLAVILLVATIAAVVATGLFSGGEENAGPFAGAFGLELSEMHEVLFRVLQGLVAIHLIGVAVETVKSKDALVPAMVVGWKRRRADEPGRDADRAGLSALLAALALGVATSALLMIVPAPASFGEDAAGGDELEEGGSSDADDSD